MSDRGWIVLFVMAWVQIFLLAALLLWTAICFPPGCGGNRQPDVIEWIQPRVIPPGQVPGCPGGFRL